MAATTSTVGGRTQAYVTMQVVGSTGHGPRPSWVSYLVRNSAGRWIHTTVLQVPAHAVVHVTVLEYDSNGNLRNPVWATVTGTIGSKEYVTGTVDDKKVAGAGYTVLPADAAAHTFAVPALGVNVPLAGYGGNATLCGTTPCTPNFPHDVDRFSFRTAGAGTFRWQCFMPCGLSYVDGNGGPMGTLGYMMGFLKVGA